MNDHGAAWSDLNKVLAQEPLHKKALYNRSLCNSKMERYYEAESDLLILLKMEKRHKNGREMFEQVLSSQMEQARSKIRSNIDEEMIRKNAQLEIFKQDGGALKQPLILTSAMLYPVSILVEMVRDQVRVAVVGRSFSKYSFAPDLVSKGENAPSLCEYLWELSTKISDNREDVSLLVN